MTTFRISSLYLYNHLILELPVTSGSCKSAPLVVVEERETSDHVLRETVNTTGDVMANKLPESKHGKASIADLVGAADSHRFVVQWWPGSNLVTGVDAVREGVVDKANGKEGSNPELAGDYLDSLDTVRDILEGKAWVKLAWEAVKLRDDVTNYGKHRCAAIFDLPGTDEVESVLVDVFGQAKGIKISDWSDSTDLVLVPVESSGVLAHKGWSKGRGGRKGEGSDGGCELHVGR